MKAASIAANRTVELRELSIPRIGAHEILVHMKACGICGTDLEKIHGENITPPVLGHEVAGEIEDTGTEILDFKKGDRVVVHHHISCRTCYYCKNGLETLCEAYPKNNLDPCGLAEYFRVPATLVEGGTVYKLPDSVSFEEGSQVEPTACCIRALKKSGIRPGTCVAVFGVGPVGLTHVQMLHLFGAAPIFTVDVIRRRREMSVKIGAAAAFDPITDDVPNAISLLTDGRGADYAVVATGNPKAIEQSIGSVRKGGTVILFGAPARGAMMSVDVSQLFLNEIRFLSSYSTSEAEMQMALELIRSKRVNPLQLITHRLPLEDVAEAFRLSENGEAIKVIVTNQ
jgi:L-iditol 2-dehydrogenase